ncbi:MAG: DUF4143 domain-containing protein [Candidatus Methanoplasma sp.]|jgi:predicted AAA+ superfamily ATPase|nr:DUF4143 domain-containing protein [Candidatus Methanoplasma sp.]
MAVGLTDISIREMYHPRAIDALIEETMKSFGGVLITGPKWCGKSWTGIRHSASQISIGTESVRQKAMLMPESVLDGEHPRLIDEWQDAPGLWDVARERIDRSGRKNMYIFTGSSVPPLRATSHTGTGRFARIRMRPLSLYESGDSSGIISLRGLFDSEIDTPVPSEIDFAKVTELICRGGWPSSVWDRDTDPFLVPREYLSAVANSDMARAQIVRAHPDSVSRLIRSLARNVSSPTSIATIAEDISEAGGKISPATVSKYMDALRRIFVLEEQGAWRPSVRSKASIRSTPKRHLTDPSLAAAALEMDSDMLLDDPNTAGLLFESLCYRDLCVYADTFRGKVSYYRDENGLEVDAVIESGDGRWGAAEVKLGSFQFGRAASNLLRLKKKISENTDRPGKKTGPSFLAILTASGGAAYTRPDGISVIPIDLLGP